MAVTEALLKSGAVDVNAATVTFATALHDAAVEANPEITRLLLQVRRRAQGRIWGAERANGGWTFLYVAPPFKQYGGNAIDVNARMLDGSGGRVESTGAISTAFGP